MDQSFTLGSAVEYIRQDKANLGEVLTGQGYVRQIALDHQGRRVVGIFDSSQPEAGRVFNVDVLAVNPTPEFKAKFQELVKGIAALQDEGNKAIAALASDYNAKIETLTDTVLGEGLDLSIFKQPAAVSAANSDEQQEAA